MPVAAAFAADVVLVVVFAATGRSSHDEALSVGGVAGTAWPFLVGLVAGWLIATAITHRFPLRWRTAWPVWVMTVAVGMVLRAATGAGTATAFVIVATVTLGVLLIGWRVIAGLLPRERHTAASR